LHDQFHQTWRETLHNCYKTLNYRIFKETFILLTIFWYFKRKKCLSSM
jgi:hypothetical protein